MCINLYLAFNSFMNPDFGNKLKTPRDKLERLLGQQRKGFMAFGNKLKTSRDKLERLFGQQRKRFIVRARPKQIRALSQHSEGSSRRRGQSRGPFNLLSQRPSFCNNYGKFFQASPEDYDQLKDLNVSVAVMNINQGAMVTPYYNSKSTILVLVAEGSGNFELACPHLASQSQQHRGQDNIWNQVESEAKELSFNVPSRELDEVGSSGSGSKKNKEGNEAFLCLQFWTLWALCRR
ncbi:hypothetical protein ACH5RR_031341 [Cinchona calisaya]|uniref:Cupin type-1 domain-containing protein n=1 Tax=Cinchona calisaya TaxID=153742 RepID=A0ABD2YIZ2_9GENT